MEIDTGVKVKFYHKSTLDPKATRDAGGIKKYKQVEMVAISYPKESTDEVHHMVTDKYRTLYREQYAAFKNDRSQAGTPLHNIDIDDLTVRNLTALGFNTLEKLAVATPDSEQMYDLITAAKDYLADKPDIASEPTNDETQRINNRIDSLEGKIDMILKALQGNN